MKEWYTVTEMSKLTKISKAKIYKLIDSGDIDAKWFDNRHNISANELLYFKRRHKNGIL